MAIKSALLAVVFLAAGAGAASAQQAGQFGAGVILGRPIGGTIKYWMSSRQAFDLGVGFADDTVIYADYLWHGWDVLPQPSRGKLGVYVGLGPRIQTAADTQFAIRTIAGLDYWISNHPVELFLEGGPVFRMAPSSDVDADIGLGVRFYFGGEPPARK